MKNTAKYAWSFSRNSSFLMGLFYYAAPCIIIYILYTDFEIIGYHLFMNLDLSDPE